MRVTRDDIRGEPICPAHIAAFLLRVGHKNPFGEPNYRLVHTSTRYQLQGGAWKIWPEGLSIQDMGGMKMTDAGLMIPSDYKPIRVDICVKPVKKYNYTLSGEPDGEAFEGWLLERWVPASFYGTQADWEALCLREDHNIPILGPYPTEGDYEPCTFPAAEVPAMDYLRDAVSFQDRCDERVLKGDVEQRIKDRIYQWIGEHEAEQKQREDENEYRIKEFLSPWKSTSLEAGRWRSDAAKRAGVREHAGN